MPHALEWLIHVLRDPAQFIGSLGAYAYAAIAGILFFETAFVILPFLPGDSMLIPVGMFCQNETLNLWAILILAPLAAILGDLVNFHIGKFFGPRLFTEKSKGIFKLSNLEATREFYAKHGTKAIVVARFIPIVRQLAPFVAGMEGMQRRKFVPISVAAAFLWVWTCVFVGFFFGRIEFVRKNFELGLVILFVLMAIGLFVERKIHAHVKASEAKRKLAMSQTVESAD